MVYCARRTGGLSIVPADPRGRRTLFAYLFSALCVIVITIIDLALGGLWANRTPLVLFVLAVTGTALFGGFWPAMLVTALGAIASAYLFLGEPYNIAVEEPADQVLLMLFVASGVLIAAVSARMHRALEQSRVDRRAAEEARRRLERHAEERARSLEATVAERTTAMELLLESERAARSEAERASRQKDEFVATVSHELRTPLNAILGWSHLLRRPAQAASQLQKGLEAIERNARHLAQLVSDLLDVSRIMAGKLGLELAPVDLACVVEGALETTRAGADAKGIALRFTAEPAGTAVVGDAQRLSQVVWNLVSNAIKFTPRGGRVDVALARAGARVELSVSDTGQGIAPEFLPHLFERFRQADSSIARWHGGLGLGLSIVKNLVELHGGEVSAASAGLGQGATFTVDLPVHAMPTGARRLNHGAVLATRRGAAALSGVKILLVDDEPDAREIGARVLEDSGAAVWTAASGPEALAMLRQHHPDVLVSDIGMPGMDGYEMIRQLRNGDAAPVKDLPAVALTAFARPEDRQQALAAGFQEHLAKPLEPGELVTTVAGLWARSTDGHGRA